jgi:hypothetical protein
MMYKEILLDSPCPLLLAPCRSLGWNYRRIISYFAIGSIPIVYWSTGIVKTFQKTIDEKKGGTSEIPPATYDKVYYSTSIPCR